MIAAGTGAGRLPVPPSTLSAAELKVWRHTIEAAPSEFFKPHQAHVIALLCAHVVQAEKLRAASLAKGLAPADAAKFAALAQGESTLALRYARALRLTAAAITPPRSKPQYPSPQSIDVLFKPKE